MRFLGVRWARLNRFTRASGATSSQLSALLLASALTLLSACKGNNALIEKVTFKPSENLEVVRVSLVFSSRIQSDLAGGFSLKDYGYLFVNPYTPSQPFEIGFDLNTSIVNDQDYVKLSPTEVLPNGIPIGLPNAVVEVRAPSPISSKFDLFGYVDVLRLNWLGVSAMFGFLDDKYFPAGLSLSQAFLRNNEGRPGVIGSVFGPTVAGDGTLIRNGGIALFANVRQLISQIGGSRPGETLEFYADGTVEVSGQGADAIRNQPERLREIQENLIRGFSRAKSL
jgi:hypothetical protein